MDHKKIISQAFFVFISVCGGFHYPQAKLHNLTESTTAISKCTQFNLYVKYLAHWPRQKNFGKETRPVTITILDVSQ